MDLEKNEKARLYVVSLGYYVYEADDLFFSFGGDGFDYYAIVGDVLFD